MVRRWSFLAVCLAGGLLGAANVARSADNLIFVPLPPCRVIDTRVAGAGGPLVAGTPRSFIFRGPTLNYQNPAPFANQGGSATGCGIPDLASDVSPAQNIAKAVAINIVAVGPAGAGDLRAWPANQTIPNASVINYAALPGLNVANGVIVPMCDQVSAAPCPAGDITFRADVSGTHLVVDVVGYFHAGSVAFTLSNTELGHQALQSDTTGVGNTGLGFYALRSTTVGAKNTATGFNALYLNTAGYENTASGWEALSQNGTGAYNTAVGAGALLFNTTGLRNTATGSKAMHSNVSGALNVATGRKALFSNVDGSENVAIGALALYANTSGSYNTAVGFRAMPNGAGTQGNTAVGSKALYFNASGAGVTAIGDSALQGNTTGSWNVASGAGALFSNTTGSANAAFGFQALNSSTTGGSNTAVGYRALLGGVGDDNTAVGARALGSVTGSRNIAIGSGAGQVLGTTSDNIDIGNSGVAADSAVIRIGASGTQTAAFIAGIRGVTTANNDAVAVLVDSAGQLGTVSSSIRFKEDVHDLGAAADRVLDLRPVSFRYKKPFANGEKPVQYGLIAEEVEKVLPDLVAYGKDGKPETVKYQVLPTLLLAELEKEHAALAALRQEKDREIAALMARVEALERRSQEGEAPTRAAPAPR